MPVQPTARAHGVQRSRGLGGGAAPCAAALTAGCLGPCPRLFSLMPRLVQWAGTWSLLGGLCPSTVFVAAVVFKGRGILLKAGLCVPGVSSVPGPSGQI